MTITEVISTLQAIQAEHGDLKVLVLNPEFQTILELIIPDFAVTTEGADKSLLIEQISPF